LFFTIKQAVYTKLKNDVDISIIGHITDKNSGCKMVSKSNVVHELKAQGWNAFKG
jgi:thiamine-monophosphate kinase